MAEKGMDGKPTAWLAQALVTRSDLPLPARLCIAFAAVNGAAGAVMTLGAAAGERNVVCATDRLAEKIEDTQSVVQEGPSLDALRTREQVGFYDAEMQRARWPLLAQAWDGREVLPLLKAFPVAPSGHLMGTLLVYGDDGGPAALAAPQGQVLADTVGIVLAQHPPPDPGEEERWSVRDRVSQATGMVMAQLRVGPADALALLRAHAFARDTTLSEISGSVVAKEVRFDEDGAAEGGEDR